jgi:hypothetical protein
MNIRAKLSLGWILAVILISCGAYFFFVYESENEQLHYANIEDADAISVFYYKNNERVYFVQESPLIEIKRADPSSFEFITTERAYSLPQMDAEYAKDKNSVYRQGHIIRGADPKTFKYILDRYTVDKDNVFYKGEIIPGADPNTLIVGPRWSWSVDKPINGYAKDKNHVYADGIIVPSLDPETFDLEPPSRG